MGMNFTQYDEVPSKNELMEAVESAPVMCEKKIVYLNLTNDQKTNIAVEDDLAKAVLNTGASMMNASSMSSYDYSLLTQ